MSLTVDTLKSATISAGTLKLTQNPARIDNLSLKTNFCVSHLCMRIGKTHFKSRKEFVKKGISRKEILVEKRRKFLKSYKK